ncbi:TatD family hydrolase [Gimesia sp.]|uniref:TatD family hydrolase n=1 Tax=Gimesia sp. TaxID=2024833 RepID=UPI000C6A2325|nr:TatD family hydrolase [Gimesia sp.]MAX35554.1 hydrolase TatD [Gimesia sp.]HAH49246.1 hydrolase TatD [Planctomycetaceae bacterium]|tara:strand:+ start:24428 stop:25201 length:774 start_codon:yes stop_codon:yes gene_type:complete
MKLFDTHAHLDEEAFHPDRPETVQNAIDAGVETILSIGITAESSQRAVDLAATFENVFAVVGIQPNYVAQMKPNDWELIESLSTAEKVVGIGETGLDRYWDYAPIELQQEYFRKHIQLSRNRDLPFVIHCREAEADVIELLQQEANGVPFKGIMHSFCGSPETAVACLDLGLHISFAGMLTFKKNDELRETARQIPLDRLLVETDAPYLAPVPMRGKRNEPAFVKYTCACLAELHQKTTEEMAEITTANARALFNIA